MRKTGLLLILFAFGHLFLSGCRGSDPNPELRDAIYKDLQSKSQTFTDQNTLLQNQLAENEAELFDPETTELMKLALKQEHSDLEDQIRVNEQLSKYYLIRARKRAAYVRLKTLQTSRGDSNWDPQREREQYEAQNALRTASRNWSDRVPELYPTEE